MGDGHIGVKEKTKIAFFLATSGHSGVDRAMKNLIPSIASRGYEVDLIKVKNHGPYLDSIPDGVNIIKLPTSHVYSSFPYLLRYLKKYHPYVFLTDKDRVNRCAICAKLITRAPTRLVVSIGTTVSINLKSRGIVERWVQRKSIGNLYKYADKVVVTSQGVARDMVDYTGLSEELIEVLPSPVIDASLLTKRLPLPPHPWFKPGSPPVILGVGELGMRKDFSTLIKAFKIVTEHMDTRLVILGKGKQRDLLMSLVNDLSLNHKVDFPGFVKDPYPYMAHSKLFAFSSLWEGLGFVLIEALAVGTPVVSTDCPSGPAEILENGKYGKLVPVKDPEKMAEAIIETLKNPKDPEFLKQAARPYTIEQSTDAYLTSFGLPLYWNG